MAASCSRVFEAFLSKFCHGYSSFKCPRSYSLHMINLLDWKTSTSISNIGKPPLVARKIWTSPPVCMGRRSSKIATRKGAQDLKKAKRYSKIGKEVVSTFRPKILN